MNSGSGAFALDDTVPENRETRRVDRRGAVLDLLHNVRAKVERASRGTAQRDALGKLETLQTAVQRWDLCPPRPEQLSAVFELLIALYETTENELADAAP
jgi:hypothetical protein